VAVMTIASFLGVLAGLITRIALWTGLGRSRNNQNLLLVLVPLVSAVVYVISFLLTRLLSRYRELSADRAGALLTGRPSPLASPPSRAPPGRPAPPPTSCSPSPPRPSPSRPAPASCPPASAPSASPASRAARSPRSGTRYENSSTPTRPRAACRSSSARTPTA